MYRVISNDTHHQDILRLGTNAAYIRGPEAISLPLIATTFESFCRE